MLEVKEKQAVMDVNEFKTHMKKIFEALVKTNLVKTILLELER